ncbi:small ribosomal subunit protein mS23 [Tautogolabrus adspersus]
MAGSRLEKFGTVFTRVRDLMRSGVVKPSEKPIWFHVYEAFPPKRDPLHVKAWRRPGTKIQESVPEIFYREDEVRAKFYELYVPGRPFDLSRSNFVSTCQRFVDKYTELQSRAEFEDSALFEETGKALLAEGVMLRRRGDLPVSAEPRDPVLSLKLREMLAEQQTDTGGEETTQQTTHTDTQTA